MLDRWNDERLDELNATVRVLADRQRELEGYMGAMRTMMELTSANAERCLVTIEEVRSAQKEAETHREEREERDRESRESREEEQRKERVADRRYWVGTLLVVMSLVIAALAIFLG